MGSLYGTHEIVELRDEPNLSDYSKAYNQERENDKEKRLQGCSRYLEDDINKLFEAINVRSSFNGSSFSDETGGTTPRRNPSKKPMRMSLSSSSSGIIGNSEPVSLKQALRGLCISQASEMAAMKRSSKIPGSPAFSFVRPSESKIVGPTVKVSEILRESEYSAGGSLGNEPVGQEKSNENVVGQEKSNENVVGQEKSTKNVVGQEKSTENVGPTVKLNEFLQEPESGSRSTGSEPLQQEKSTKSAGQEKLTKNTGKEKSTKNARPEKSTKNVGPTTVKLNEILQESESGSQEKTVISFPSPSCIPSEDSVNSEVIKSTSKSTFKSRYKGKSTRTSPRPVKTVVIHNKALIKKKLKQDFASSTTAKAGPDSTKQICQKCHCAIKDEKQDSNKDSESPLYTSDTTGENSFNSKKMGKNKTVSFLNKSDFTQSSNSSICEYSSSTSISEDRNTNLNLNPNECIIINRPHMSQDIKWQAINHVMKKDGYLGLRHFNLLKKLGCGDIGTVYLAELIGTNCPFAIKIMDNEFLERRQKMPRAHMEREILSILDHPFLPTLYAHFVSENLSCLVMEYCPGGDLHVLRQKQPARFFHEQAARFYVAEVLLALEYLHMLGIVYRDLKPENILVREDGHIMVTDFDLSLRCSVNPILLQSSNPVIEPPRVSGPCAGSSCIDPFCIKPTCQVSCFRARVSRPHRKPKPEMARWLPQLVAEPTEARSNSFVGTHEYLAPEIIKGDGHGSAVDWWTFGVFLYELLYGKTPFKGSVNDQTLANVVLESLRFPDTPLVSFHARDLIKGLLAKEPENRLGFRRGAAEIKRHPFFDGLNWALIRCASPPELPEPYDVVGSTKSTVLEKAKKYLDYDGGSSGGHLEFELF